MPVNPTVSRLLAIIENRDFGADDVVDAQALYPVLKESLGSELEAVCCHLFNFTADTDIRVADRDHRRFQESELNRLIKLLKTGDIDQAKEITFLKE